MIEPFTPKNGEELQQMASIDYEVEERVGND